MLSRGLSAKGRHFPFHGLRSLQLKPHIVTGIYCRFKTSYIVLLPEIPEDTADTNPLLSQSELPDFSELNAEKCYTGVGKCCINYETGLWRIEEQIKDDSFSKTFSNLIGGLEKLYAPLSYSWSTVKTLYSVKNEDVPTASYLKIHDRARKARGCKYQSRPIYNACKDIYVKDSSLDECQRRVIRKFLLEARLNGIELTEKEKEKLANARKKADEQKTIYRKKLQESSRRFSYRIIDHEMVRDFPDDLLRNMSFSSGDYLKGPWTVTHHPLIYQKFLEYCPYKDLRWSAWKAYVSRCSVFNEGFDNTVHIEDLRQARSDEAKILGFKTFADMSMETKMAGSVDNVQTVIASLFAKAKEKQLKEIDSLKEFALSRGFEGELDECDIPFWRRKQLTHLTHGENIKFEEYFPFDHVWPEVLSLCSNLFGIQFEEVPQGQVSTWHPDVRFFNVLSAEGHKIASFYLDAFKRPYQKLATHTNSAWMLTLKTRCDAVETSPLASLIFNFAEPSEGESTLLSLEDVQSLLKKFGHALQHLLSSVPHAEVSGLTNIEWDAVDLCSNFLLNWLYEPSVLEKMSKHFASGEPLSKQAIKSLLLSRSHMAAHDMCNELFLAHLDMKMHSETTHWLDIFEELWPVYIPFKLHKFNSIPCWFSPIMSEVWPAAYYSHIWSKMLAADAFGAFKECDPQEIPIVGKRFRDTFLSLGGGCHAAEVFRQFRGRDPSPEALHSLLKIS